MAMAKGRERAEWGRTAQLSVLLANPNRDTEEHPEPFQAWEFNPFTEAKPPKVKKPEVKLRVSCLKWLCENGEIPQQQPPDH